MPDMVMLCHIKFFVKQQGSLSAVLLAFACDNWKTIHINEKGFAVSYRK
jgi:hypothetical protein